MSGETKYYEREELETVALPQFIELGDQQTRDVVALKMKLWSMIGKRLTPAIPFDAEAEVTQLRNILSSVTANDISLYVRAKSIGASLGTEPDPTAAGLLDSQPTSKLMEAVIKKASWILAKVRHLVLECDYTPHKASLMAQIDEDLQTIGSSVELYGHIRHMAEDWLEHTSTKEESGS